MAGMGPAPKPATARRRTNPTVAMNKLPAAGRSGPTPPWPLPDDIRRGTAVEQMEAKAAELAEDAKGTGPEARQARFRLQSLRERIEVATQMLNASQGRELELWAELWATPQAVAWERLRWTNDVAVFVRWSAQAEMGDLDAAREARQWSDRLGLNPLALLRLRWEIAEETDAEVRGIRTGTSSTRARTTGARRGIKAVD